MKKKNRKQELNKDSLSTSKTFGFRLSFVPFKSIILKNVYAAEAFLLHIKILEKQEKEINASFKINHCWHSLECYCDTLLCLYLCPYLQDPAFNFEVKLPISFEGRIKPSIFTDVKHVFRIIFKLPSNYTEHYKQM